MGLFDSVLGAVLNSNAASGGSSGMTQVLEGLLQQHGGIGGLVGQLAQAGLAEHTQSWVGTGQNLPVSATQIIQALGAGKVGEIAQHLGIDPQQAGTLLAQVLPHVINHFTPNGQLPTGAGQMPSSDQLSAALGSLLGRAS
jgi:uncharacterized protein YidB (DUF937 family)